MSTVVAFALGALLVLGAVYAYRRGDELGRQEAEKWRQRNGE